ncbi:thiamine phosphate synthase [Colwellia echini]|uniref:Thiamine-phosphate synthase n=1 Tax=Colwellia echini TaxID=1982103 RepID=A0ABY3MZY3_9GAMM|nr:thiamine phosphate synthase [Colwellia echini]TYK66562.1 thiamine phosphate synthase [Colwellia echini]
MIKTINNKPIIWTISGSDCSGGAGIAADIKTGHSLGVEVCQLITANTVQSSQQLLWINPVDVDVLSQQAQILLADKPPSVIKIGLLANIEQVQWLTALLQDYKKQLPELLCIYDTVGQASVGGCFNTLTLAQLTPLLQQIDIITPNFIEAHSLNGYEYSADKLACQAVTAAQLAKALHQRFAINSVIIKGGHGEDKHSAIDYCLHQLNALPGKQDNQDKIQEPISYQLSAKRLASSFSHGGGCTFASALGAFLAQGYLMRDAFTLAKAYISQGFSASMALSQNRGHQYYGAFEQTAWPTQAQYFPQVIDELSQQYKALPAFNSLDLNGEKLGLYPVIDSLYWLERLLPLGLNLIQLRVKNVSDDELENIIKTAVNLAKPYKTRLFINDYWELAIKHGAYGVHIGQEDLQAADLAAIQASGTRLGISTHGCYEFLLAQQLQPSYLAIGAIFPTKTKDMTGQIQGLDNLKQVLALRPKASEKIAPIPVVAIGGINLERAPKVVTTGVESIAVVTAITEAESTYGITSEQAVDRLIFIINGISYKL